MRGQVLSGWRSTTGRVSNRRPWSYLGCEAWGIIVRGTLGKIEVWRLHFNPSVGPVPHQGIKVEVDISWVRQDDVWQGGLG